MKTEKQLARAYSELAQRLTGKRFLTASGLTRKEAAALLNREVWLEKLGRVLPIRRRVLCADVLELCRPEMERLAGSEQPEKGWLVYIYGTTSRILYPDLGPRPEDGRCRAAALFYLEVLRLVLDYEREALPFDPAYDFAFLSQEEFSGCTQAEEYRRFLEDWREQHIYQLLRLGNEATPFSTLSHIAGVHYVAMAAARGLAAAGVPVDLALVSGAAAGHDLGKYGCKPGERVPYLHYFYTDQWFTRMGLPVISHIAANHSTWDLEPENLTVESLLLIYADFRSKQERGPDGREVTRIYGLDDSFQIILSKLDNVDAKKLRRYQFVYARLHDFEDYMRSLGVDVDLTGHPAPVKELPSVVLRSVDDTIQSLVFLGIRHNLDVMHTLADERGFGNILEAARSEKDWKNIRAYLDIFREYSTYLSGAQKSQLLDFLYELLCHREGDIRRYAADLTGQVVARFNAGYRKERPADTPDVNEQTALSLWELTLARIIRPDHKLTAQHKNWIGYSLKGVVGSLLAHALPEDLPEFFQRLLDWYRQPGRMGDGGAFALLDTLYDLPVDRCTDEEIEMLVEFAAFYFLRDALPLRISAARFFKVLTARLPHGHPSRRRIALLATGMPVENDVTTLFLQYRILSNLELDVTMHRRVLYGTDVVSEIFLDNLKTGTPWIIKAVNIKLLADQVDQGHTDHILHIATHLCNLIKVSEQVVVRCDAGAALLRIVKLLTPDQRNEISVELVKGLEVGEYEFSKYIPQYLGEFALWLPPEQLDELIENLRASLSSANERIVCGALDTLAVILEYYGVYASQFAEPSEENRRRADRLLGCLLGGLASHRVTVRQEALQLLGQLFASTRLSEAEKNRLFGLCFQKLLFFLDENQPTILSLYYRAAALSHICRFISNYHVENGRLPVSIWNKVAFFPGTFDPFTLSHKGIVRAIRDMGYEVYLAIDEFSWSKNTQPHLVRRQIVSMSVADMFHVHLFPDEIPVNIANPSDLARLKAVFPGREVYLVVGSDVIAGASAYTALPRENSVHNMNHIVFRRASQSEREVDHQRDPKDFITGKVVELELPTHLEDISSTRIRENIDLNRDISNLIDPVAQQFIYQRGLYLREPKFKRGLPDRKFRFRFERSPEFGFLRELTHGVLGESPEAGLLAADLLQTGDGVMALCLPDGAPVGFARLRFLQPEQLFSTLHDLKLADHVRRSACGRILLISGVYLRRGEPLPDAWQLLVAETVATSLAHTCNYGVCAPLDDHCTDGLKDALERQGFVPAEQSERPVWLVDMHQPLVLMQNLATTLKEPFASDERALAACRAAHRRLQLTMTRMYPGKLVLSLPSGSIMQRMVDRITQLNGVPREPTQPRVLGPVMCVPFGKILRGRVVPNTVTKTLHTDKVYEPDLSRDAIEPFPGYSPLISQIRAIKSFGRPVVLVDDLLHHAGRLKAILPLFKQEGVEIRTVLVGMLSGYGWDSMADWGLPVESVYTIPTLRHWFVESTLYPFIGGDTVRRSTRQAAGLQPSINMILPYTTPRLEDCGREALFDFSECCLENARDLFRMLEGLYRAQYGRNLTLARLSEAVILPLCPDKGSCMSYDENLAPSVYLENDLELLRRTRAFALGGE